MIVAKHAFLHGAALKAIMVLMLWHAGGTGLFAQTDRADTLYVRIIDAPEVKVYVSPVENGTEEEAAYFKENFEMELEGAAYDVAETREDSDFYLTLSISREEGSPPNNLEMTLFNTRTGQEMVAISWGYTALSDMTDWNLYLIYQAMANAPMVKLLPDAEMTGALAGNRQSGEPPAVAATGEKEPHTMSFYTGLRAGGFLNLYAFQTSRGYEGGTSRAFSGEAALLAEFHPFRFFSIQAEAAVVYEKFGNARETAEAARHNSVFSVLSLHFPLLIKAPVSFGRFSLSPFAGAYYILSLWPAGADFGGDETSYSWRVDPPLGISLGIDMGATLRPGKFFMGLRYDQDLGTTLGEDLRSPLYSRFRLGLTLGWAFRFGKRL